MPSNCPKCYTKCETMMQPFCTRCGTKLSDTTVLSPLYPVTPISSTTTPTPNMTCASSNSNNVLPDVVANVRDITNIIVKDNGETILRPSR